MENLCKCAAILNACRNADSSAKKVQKNLLNGPIKVINMASRSARKSVRKSVQSVDFVSAKSGETTETPRGDVNLERGEQTLGSLKLCRDDKSMVGLPASEKSKPMRGGTMEAWSRGPRG